MILVYQRDCVSAQKQEDWFLLCYCCCSSVKQCDVMKNVLLCIHLVGRYAAVRPPADMLSLTQGTYKRGFQSIT
jgi:hypothetical protein